ncbi:molybdopterin molybdotransferase MoeA [Tenacibaculum sp. S7007]|uniref:Molybdopterin molybdenumtransferase n=1 Tax=Tenacibaculum pelagium TaxID=2759527 RepID=A0A839ARB1_9FLAO|nr:molybdopterin molybdotransferase MoeA [Tenacibaculum pelagium]MBA6156799.1 molybdopterin molybdotransferase MoeA [Tenacibaculum pelagium]
MISVEEAKHIILQNTVDFGIEEIPFIQSVGRVLKEDIVADRDFPPFNRVAMDGIAINYSYFKNGQRSFTIEGIQPAGSPQLSMQNSGNCTEVMTGAVLPNNCDTVIRYEDVTIENGIATITVDNINDGQNIHEKGKDKQQGDLLISKNTIVSPAEIGVIATVGKSIIKVAKQPKVMIVSTGDELVDVNETPLDHQIRRSNVYTLVSLLGSLNIPSETAHITDNKAILKEKIDNYLQEYDLLLFSGAVSKGKFDFLPEVLDELGVEKLFHKVTQRPGKPFWMGRTDALNMNSSSKNKTLVFAFPGNPVSTFVNCVAYFYSWYYKSIGGQKNKQSAILTEDVNFKPNLTYFLQVKLENKEGQLFATPVKGNGSGDLVSLTEADGFIELPKTENIEFKKGSVYPLIRYK